MCGVIFAVDSTMFVERSVALFDKLCTGVVSLVTIFVSFCICCLISIIIENI